eukprot:tig00000093_g3592.t1
MSASPAAPAASMCLDALPDEILQLVLARLDFVAVAKARLVSLRLKEVIESWVEEVTVVLDSPADERPVDVELVRATLALQSPAPGGYPAAAAAAAYRFEIERSASAGVRPPVRDEAALSHFFMTSGRAFGPPFAGVPRLERIACAAVSLVGPYTVKGPPLEFDPIPPPFDRGIPEEAVSAPNEPSSALAARVRARIQARPPAAPGRPLPIAIPHGPPMPTLAALAAPED